MSHKARRPRDDRMDGDHNMVNPGWYTGSLDGVHYGAIHVQASGRTLVAYDGDDGTHWRTGMVSECSDLTPLVPARPATREDLPSLDCVLDFVVDHLNARGGLPRECDEAVARAEDLSAQAARSETRAAENAELISDAVSQLEAERREHAGTRKLVTDLEAELAHTARDLEKARTDAVMDHLATVAAPTDDERVADIDWRQVCDLIEVMRGQGSSWEDIGSHVENIFSIRTAAVDDEDVSTDCYDEDDDPVVYAVCESDLPEVTRSERGYWLVEGDVCARGTTADTMRRRVEYALARAARLEAIRRAIEAHEQDDDDTERQVDALADSLYGDELVTGQMRDVLRRLVAAAVLGQEADR